MPFQKGQIANPNGRPPMSMRQVITDSFLNDLTKLWREKGPKILERIAEEQPAAMLTVMAKFIPQDVAVTHSGSITHEHVRVSETAAWIIEAGGTEAEGPSPKPLPV